MNRYNSSIFEQSRTQRVSPQFVQHPSIQQNGSAKSYSFQAKSPLRQQKTPLKDTKLNIGSNSRQGMVNFSPCPIRYMQLQSSQKPLLNLGRKRMDSEVYEQDQVSDKQMSVGSKNSKNIKNQQRVSFPIASSQLKNQDFYLKQQKMSDDQNTIAQHIVNSLTKNKPEIKISESKKLLFSQNYFSSPFKNKNQIETPIKEGQNLSSQKKQQHTLRGYILQSSSKKNGSLANDSKIQKINLLQTNLNQENEDDENRLSSNTTKKKYVTKFKGGSQVKSNFKLNQNSLQVKEYECMINRATDSKNYQMILQAFESQQNENVNINNIHYMSNNKNSERQSGRSNFQHTINSLSQMQRADELMMIAGSNRNLKHHSKQEFSPCRKFMHQDSSLFENEKKKNLLSKNNEEQPIISPNFNFKGKIDSKAIGQIKFDQGDSPQSQHKKRKGLFIEQNRLDHQNIINNMKREFVENPKKYQNGQWMYNDAKFDHKNESFNPYFCQQQDFNINQNMHQMMFQYQNYFHGIKQRNPFVQEQGDISNKKRHDSYSKKKKKHQSGNKLQINNSQNFNHDSAQKLIKNKAYNMVNSNTKEEKLNEQQDRSKMIPLICPSVISVGGKMNEAFRLAQQMYKDKKLLQQSSISPTSIKKSNLFCNNSGTTIKRHQYSIQGTDSGQKNGDKNQMGSSGGKEYGRSSFQQTPSDMEDAQSSSEEGEDDVDDEEECSSSQPTSGEKAFLYGKSHFLKKNFRKMDYEQYMNLLQQQESYNFHFQHFQKDNFRIHMDGMFSTSFLPRQQFPFNQYSQNQANFINHFAQNSNQNMNINQIEQQKYKSNFQRGEGFLSNNKVQKGDLENERESFRIPLMTSKREQIKSPCYQRNFQSTIKNEVKNPEIEIVDQESKYNSHRKDQKNSQQNKDEQKLSEESKSSEKRCRDVGQINIICPMINHYCSHNQLNDQQQNHFYAQMYQQKYQNFCMNGFPFQNQSVAMENQKMNSLQHQFNIQNQFNSFIQNNQYNQNQNPYMGFNNQYGMNFFPGFGNNFLSDNFGQNYNYPQVIPQMAFNMQQSDSKSNFTNQINGSENKKKNNQSEQFQTQGSIQKKQDAEIELGKRSFQTMNTQNLIDMGEKTFSKKKRNVKISKQGIELKQNDQSQKRRKKSQKDEKQMQDVDEISEGAENQNLQISFQNTFIDNKNQESNFKNNQITQIDVFDKPDDPKESRTIKKKSGIDQSASSLMQKTFFHITPQKNFNMENNMNRVGGTAPHYHSNTVAESTQITPIRNNNSSQQKSAKYINMPRFDPCSAPSGDTLKDEEVAQPDDQNSIANAQSVYQNDQNYSLNHYQDRNKDEINTDFHSNIFQQNQYSIQFISQIENVAPRRKQRQQSSKRSENYNEYGGQANLKLAQQQKDFLNKQNEANIQKMIERIESETIDQKELFRKIENGETTVTQCKGCKCKGSCLKLYCECLRNNALCGQDCQCTHNGQCYNNLEHSQQRRQAIEQILKRNINAFENKVDVKNVHSKGCNCKNSGCQKRYCECYERNVPCTDKCKCKQCKNDKVFMTQTPECQNHFHSINNPEETFYQVDQFQNQPVYQHFGENTNADSFIQSNQFTGQQIFQLVDENNLNRQGQTFDFQKMQLNSNHQTEKTGQNLINQYEFSQIEHNNMIDIAQLQSDEVLQNIIFDNQENQLKDEGTDNNNNQKMMENLIAQNDFVNCSFESNKNKNEVMNQIESIQEDECNLVTFNNQLTVVRQNENNQSDNSHFKPPRPNLFQTKQQLIRKKQQKLKAQDDISKNVQFQQTIPKNEILQESFHSVKQANYQQQDELFEQEIYQTPGFTEKSNQTFQSNDIKIGKFNQNIKSKSSLNNLNSDVLNIKQNNNNQEKGNLKSVNNVKQHSQKQSDIYIEQMKEVQADLNEPIILEIQLKYPDKEQEKDVQKKNRKKNFKIEKMETRHQRKLREQQQFNNQNQDESKQNYQS